MPRRDTTLVKKLWQERPDIDRQPVYQWIDLIYQPDHAYRIAFAFRDWLTSDRNTPAPNLVEYVGIYGYTRLRLKTWKLPIKLSADEMARWREAGYYVKLEDFYEQVAQVAGGFLKLAGTDPQLTAQIIQRQLDEKLAELDRLAGLPLEEYTPKWQEWQIRENFKKKGLSGTGLEEAVDLEMLDDDHDFETDRFEKPFALRQQLDSFEWGMECLRLIVLGENAPELGLPNKPLFEAFMQIDLNGLLARLAETDEKLRRIWQNLAKYKCYCLNADHEPKRFWWRHYQPKRAGKSLRT